MKGWQPTSEEARDIFQLWDVVLTTFAVFGQQRQILQVLPAGMSGVQFVELPVHYTPSLDLLFCKLNPGYWVSTETRSTKNVMWQKPWLYLKQLWKLSDLLFVGHSKISKVLSPFPVHVIFKTLIKTNVALKTAEYSYIWDFKASHQSAIIPGGRRPAQSHTSGHGLHICPSLKFSSETKVHHTYLRREPSRSASVWF